MKSEEDGKKMRKGIKIVLNVLEKKDGLYYKKERGMIRYV
jgi:hypothetical protein